MTRARSWFGFALIAGLAAACAPKEPATPAPPAVDSTQVRTAVDALWKQWAAAESSGSITAMMDMVADSIRIDNKGSPAILGKAAWQSFAESMLKGVDVLTEEITPDLTIAVSNDLAYQNGNYVEVTQTGKKKNTDYGRFAAAIEKGTDGKWRIRYIMAFSDSTVAAK